MTEHYFSQQPQSKSSPKTWKYQLRNKTYTFTSDIGVFSKNEVDFGSRLLIEQFTEPNITGDILDLGCGYGPIGIAIAGSFPKRTVYMTDINERALHLAHKNILQNNIENTKLIESDRFENLNELQFAAILSNPPIRAGKKIVHAMFEESGKALRKGGELWIVIQKKQGAPSAKEKLAQIFNQVEVVKRSKGYYILRAIR